MNDHQDFINRQLLMYTKHAAIMKAYVLGEKIQYRSPNVGTWHDTDCPTFTLSLEYRVVPKPKELWIICDEDHNSFTVPHATLGSAKARMDYLTEHCGAKGLKVKKFVEEVS